MLQKLTRDSKIVIVELPATEFGELLTTETEGGQISSDVYRYFQVPPRSAPQVAADLMQLGFSNVQIIDPNYHGKNGRLTSQNLDDIFSGDALGVPAISRTSKQSKKIMQMYKSARPDGIGIFGGPHFSARYEDGLGDGKADIVVIWEGDETIRELFTQLRENPNKLEDIAGIAYRDNGGIRKNPKRRLLTVDELNQLPHPYYDDAIRKGANIAVVPTSRGCRWACNFCIVTEMYGNEYRRHSIDYIIESAKQVAEMGKSFFWIDDNLPGDTPKDREYCKTLFRRIISEGLNRRYSIAQFSIHSAKDPELLKLAKQAGIDFICVGVESFNDQTLRILNKPASAKSNISACERFGDAGLLTHGMKMPGGDGDTSQSLDEELEYDKRLFHTVQYFPTGPIPGTAYELQMQSEGRLLPFDYAYFSGDYVLVRPKNFSPLGLQLKVRGLYEGFYTREHLERLKADKNVRDSAGLLIYRNIQRGIRDVLNSQQMHDHLEFLKSVS